MRRIRMAIGLVLFAACAAWGQETAGPHVLITNDDGLDAPGLVALVDALKDGYRITVCAPASEQSGTGHGITFRAPVLVEVRPSSDGVRRYAIHAKPASCVRIGITGLLVDDPPVLVLSGINYGANVGRSTWISGTVAGAREGALAGVAAVAFSARAPHGQPPDWPAAGRWAREVLDRLRAAGLPKPGQAVNVDIPFPAGEAKGVVLARVSLEPAREERYEEIAHPEGAYLFQSRYLAPNRGAPGTDVESLAQGFVTVTPLSLDQTDYRALTDFLSTEGPPPPSLRPPATPTPAPEKMKVDG
jgi:5'-nucleotidase